MIDSKKKFEQAKEKLRQEKADYRSILRQQEIDIDKSIDKLTEAIKELKKVAQK